MANLRLFGYTHNGHGSDNMSTAQRSNPKSKLCESLTTSERIISLHISCCNLNMEIGIVVLFFNKGYKLYVIKGGRNLE